MSKLSELIDYIIKNKIKIEGLEGLEIYNKNQILVIINYLISHLGHKGTW